MACSAPRLKDRKWARAGKQRGLHVAVRRHVDRSRKGSSAPRKSSGESQPEALPGQYNPIPSGLLHRKQKNIILDPHLLAPVDAGRTWPGASTSLQSQCRATSGHSLGKGRFSGLC